MPLSPRRYKLQLSVGQEVHDKLEQLQELLRHRVPDGDLARIVALAVDGLLERTLKQRFPRLRITHDQLRCLLARDGTGHVSRSVQRHEAPEPAVSRRHCRRKTRRRAPDAFKLTVHLAR